MLVGARYTRGEVLFLLSLSHDQALELDATPADSCSQLTGKDEPGKGKSKSKSAEVSLPVVVRWADVQRAKRQLVAHKEGLALVQLRAAGYSESELARLTGRDRLAVRRKWRVTVDEIIDQLGGPEPADTGVTSRVSACIRCGEKPRVRLGAVKRRVRGGWKVVQEERQASVCEDCLAPEFHARMLQKPALAA